MTNVRRATAADADELVRLRGLLLATMGADLSDDRWRQAALALLRARLDEPDPTLVAFVVDRPGGLAACVVGAVDHRLGGPGGSTGRAGYVYNVVTEPEHRRRGHSRRCMAALLDWYRENDVSAVDLRASPEGEPLYAALGFVRTRDPAMRLRF